MVLRAELPPAPVISEDLKTLYGQSQAHSNPRLTFRIRACASSGGPTAPNALPSEWGLWSATVVAGGQSVCIRMQPAAVCPSVPLPACLPLLLSPSSFIFSSLDSVPVCT